MSQQFLIAQMLLVVSCSQVSAQEKAWVPTPAVEIEAAKSVLPGRAWPVRATLHDPWQRAPVSDTEVELLMTWLLPDDGKRIERRRVRTDEHGELHEEFRVVAGADRGELRLSGAVGPATKEPVTLADARVNVAGSNTATLTTDRRIYKPGDPVHARLLVVPGVSRQSMAGREVEFELVGDEGLVMRRQATVSRFGIASASFTLPQEVPEGDFELSVYDEHDLWEERWLQISSEEQPRFSLELESPKEYVLGDDAWAVEIETRSLLGEPISEALVEVFDGWGWDVDLEDEPLVTGRTDAHGRVLLSWGPEEHGDGDSDRWSRSQFEDRGITVKARHPVSGRMVDREIVLRRSPSPMHVHWRAFDSAVEPLAGVPGVTLDPSQRSAVRYWLITQDPSGAPRPARVEVLATRVEVVEPEPGVRRRRPTTRWVPSHRLLQARTNAAGLGWVELACPTHSDQLLLRVHPLEATSSRDREPSAERLVYCRRPPDQLPIRLIARPVWVGEESPSVEAEHVARVDAALAPQTASGQRHTFRVAWWALDGRDGRLLHEELLDLPPGDRRLLTLPMTEAVDLDGTTLLQVELRRLFAERTYDWIDDGPADDLLQPNQRWWRRVRTSDQERAVLHLLWPREDSRDPDRVRLQLSPTEPRLRPGDVGRVTLQLSGDAGQIEKGAAAGLAVIDRAALELERSRMGAGLAPAFLDGAGARAFGTSELRQLLQRPLHGGRLSSFVSRAAQTPASEQWSQLLLDAHGGALTAQRSTQVMDPLDSMVRASREHHRSRRLEIHELSPLLDAFLDAHRRQRLDQLVVDATQRAIDRINARRAELERQPLPLQAEDAVLDLWGQPYRFAASFEGASCLVHATSAGWDGIWGTFDDHWAGSWSFFCFSRLSSRLTAALARDLHEGAAAPQEFADFVDLARRDLIRQESPPLEPADAERFRSLLDPWGAPWRLEWLPERPFTLSVRSRRQPESDDESQVPNQLGVPGSVAFQLMVVSHSEVQTMISDAIARAADGGELPADDEQVGALWQRALDELGDGFWAVPGSTWADYERVDGRPLALRIRSVGEDGRREPPGSYAADYLDWTVASLVCVGGGSTGRPAALLAGAPKATGSLSVEVRDVDDEPLPGAVVETCSLFHRGLAAETDADGRAVIEGVPAARIGVRVRLPAFTEVFRTPSIPRNGVEQLRVKLYRATASLTMTVTGLSPLLETRHLTQGTTASAVELERIPTGTDPWALVSASPGVMVDGADVAEEMITVTSESPLLAPPPPPAPIATPPLRRDFRDTLLWLPEVAFDADGTVTVDVPLSNDITTWEVAAVANTLDGGLATAQTTLIAELPLYVEPDLPTWSTVGDVLQAPFLLHNRTSNAITVDFTVSGAKGVAIDRATRSVDLEAGRVRRQAVEIRSRSRGEHATEASVTPRSGDVTGDAVETVVEVAPHGYRDRLTSARVLELGDGVEHQLTIELPASVPDGVRLRAEVAHGPGDVLVWAAEDLLRRPYGCTEQTLSTTLTSHWALDFLERSDHDAAAAHPSPGSRAARQRTAMEEALQATFDGMLTRQRLDGSYGYWQGSSANFDLTAYALEVLALLDERPELVGQCDPTTLERTVTWLATELTSRAERTAVAQVRRRARFASGETLSPTESLSAPRPLRLRTLLRLAETLELLRSGDGELALHLRQFGAQTDDEPPLDRLEDALRAAWDVVRSGDRVDGWPPTVPRRLAGFALLAHHLGEAASAEQFADRLAASAIRDDGPAHWQGTGESVFYSSGRAAAIVSTALAVRTLATLGLHDDLVGEGVVWLLENQGWGGGWSNTEATVEALRALRRAWPAQSRFAAPELWIDGELVEAGEVPPGSTSIDARRQLLDVQGGEGAALVRLVAEVHRPWPDVSEALRENRELDFTVTCDGEAPGRVLEPVTCTVRGRRTFGRGMLTARIGLPPGAQLDRPALDAQRDCRKAFCRWEAREGEAVFYLWPRDNVFEFTVEYEPRVAIDGVTRPSSLEQFYRAESRVVLQPRSVDISERD